MRRLVDSLPQGAQHTLHVRAVLAVGHAEVVGLPHVGEASLEVIEVLTVEQAPSRRKGGLDLVLRNIRRPGLALGLGLRRRRRNFRIAGLLRGRRRLAGLQVGGAFPRPRRRGATALLELPLPRLLRNGLQASETPLGVIDMPLGLAMCALLVRRLERLHARIARPLGRRRWGATRNDLRRKSVDCRHLVAAWASCVKPVAVWLQSDTK
mmetsp:Transcript_64973/g.186986  ORF Transcript_64973/g.186986 Transcript_64973/m.186986 type:complete len:209 (-) Transcript_64973:3-629(-)